MQKQMFALTVSIPLPFTPNWWQQGNPKPVQQSQAQDAAFDFKKLDPEQLLTTKQLASWLQIKPDTLVKARSTGMGNYPSFEKIGRCVRYRVKHVLSWLERCNCEHGGYLL